MHYAVYFPLVFGAALGLLGPAAATRLPPRPATWLLTVGGLVAAGTTLLVLAILTATLIGGHSLLAGHLHWSPDVFDRSNPVPAVVGAAAALLLAVLAVRTAWAAVRSVVELRQAHRLARTLAPGDGELVVVTEPGPVALAVPGRPGRVVVSAELLRTFDAAERAVVLGHERSHLRHRHHLHHLAARVAAAAVPLLRGLPAATSLATERWADEDSTAQGPRPVVARALFEAAVRTRGAWPRRGACLSVASTDTDVRIRMMLAGPPRRRPLLLLTTVALLTLPVLAGGEALRDAHGLFREAALDAPMHSTPHPTSQR
ncbi:M48 family metalloprotease [Nakamurella endophytica]|uniref:Peptidase M48 n=1 Tax=Nakamurella endophytica TaxID=1748367 RepID=A0A917WJ17_9ACTN|nr:M48 family metalloprotease [Nakamurella endophytica]GGM07842.1 peptidase M48 [Nakamurella endophytica]